MLTYSFHIYKWPASLLSEIAKLMRNFIWSGSCSQQKICTVSWSKVCQSKDTGGLAVRDPAQVNIASLLLLAWQLITSNEQWAHICRARFLNNYTPKSNYITSSVWPRLKSNIQYIFDHAVWSVGDGRNIRFWTDKWLNSTIAEHWNIPPSLIPAIELKVVDFIVNKKWCLPNYIQQKDPALAAKIQSITLPADDIPDLLHWTSAPDGHLTSKLAFSSLFGNGLRVPWAALLWNSYIPPTRAFITWRLLHNKIPTHENLRKRGCAIVSICCFCLKQAESSSHIFLDCSITSRLWDWFSKGIDIPLDHSSCVNLLLGSMGRGSKMVQQLLNSAIIHTIWAIWIERNQRCFHDKQQPMSTLINTILAEVKLSYSLCLTKGNSNMHDNKVSRLFDIPFKTKHVTIRQEVHWCPPPANVIKLNCDGSAIGAQSCGAIGFVIKDSNSTFLGAISSNIGHATTLEAEFSASMLAIEHARERQLNHICLETDSSRVVQAFNKNTGIPWQMRARWYNCLKFCNNIDCSCVHVLREGNQVADALAKNGKGLAMFSSQWWHSPPTFLLALLYRDSVGLAYSRLSTT